MDMAKLRAGSHLSEAEARALDALTARKMAVKERAETFISVPLLDALVAQEVVFAEQWLGATARHRTTADWARANALHMALSQL